MLVVFILGNESLNVTVALCGAAEVSNRTCRILQNRKMH